MDAIHGFRIDAESWMITMDAIRQLWKKSSIKYDFKKHPITLHGCHTWFEKIDTDSWMITMDAIRLNGC